MKISTIMPNYNNGHYLPRALATVGYGDLTPGSGAAQALAVTEALTGQLYLVTVIALLVGSFGRARQRPPGGGTSGDP